MTEAVAARDIEVAIGDAAVVGVEVTPITGEVVAAALVLVGWISNSASTKAAAKEKIKA